MASRRDQLQSYQFRNQRVVSAFVMRETDPAQSPLRRGAGALFAGLMVAVLIAAGFGVYGLLTRVGDNRWRSDGSVVVERESGASFVYLGGRLNPALNLTSAKLAAGRQNPAVHRIAAKALAGVPRGVTIGIPNAPASLPAAGQRVGLPWAMCAAPGGDPASALLVGSPGPAGAALGERGLLVSDPRGDDIQLVWHGFRHRIRDPAVTLPALFGAAEATPVGVAWSNALPAGADIAAVPVPNRGDPSRRVDGFDNGDVLAVQVGAGRTQFYLVLDDGLRAVTALQQTVLNAAFPARPTPVPVAVISGNPQVKPPAGNAVAAPPEVAPQLAALAAGTTACAVTRTAAEPPAIIVGGAAGALRVAVPTTGSTAGGRALADAVGVPGGRFALVRVPGSGGFQLVTDLGVRHPVPDADALGRLGYPAGAATEVPTALVGTIPQGVTLDPAVASRPAVTTG
ncbi:type VII secretion protein EccB [Actinoplanes teichomyceticus]|uniref:Type VII secretion protein EccB n=1 Tax=Actinoplanes teichomyceticus TaxID=1867 RepID=A0A561WIP5_ACTTI|nr:type VII secretion protein EccB [Actinoplanes teichomyceticus]TWG23714.1 type VII secretion protein EccB [Actinoplanes teichomyceticus]GIF11754.1 type VII secretion protein EccB [Actinoplanes teichomyceticus]